MISWNRVEELKSEVGEDVFAEILELFLEETEAVLQTLLKAKDTEEAESLLHFMKGSALNLGFHSLGALCQTLEDACRTGDWPIDLNGVADTYHASKDTLLASEAVSSAG